MIVSTRFVAGKESVEKRYFITSLAPDAQQCIAVSGHTGELKIL